MIEKTLRKAAIASVVLVVLVGTSMFYLPKLHQFEVDREQQRIADAELREKLNNMTGLQILDYNNEISEGEGEGNFPEQVRITIPAETDPDTVTVTVSYVTQTIEIRVPDAGEDYMYTLPIVGKSDHIDDLDIGSEEELGTISIKTDKVYEVTRRREGNYLFLDFVDPHDLYDRIVVIDPGHGGSAPGATRQGIYEKDVNLAIAMELKHLFEEAGDDSVGVYFTRTSDMNPSFENRVSLANKSNADLFVSIHCNSTNSGRMSKVHGTTVMYSESDTTLGFGSKELAQNCLEEVAKAFETENKGLTKGDSIYIIRNSEVPVALVEVGFITNVEELGKLTNPEYQKKAAEGIYQGILRSLEELS